MSNHKRKTRHVEPSRIAAPRPTIGMLLRNIADTASHTIWSGVVDAAQRFDVNLMCFAGEGIRSPIDFEAQGNIVYELVSPHRLDGLVVGTAALDWESRRMAFQC